MRLNEARGGKQETKCLICAVKIPLHMCPYVYIYSYIYSIYTYIPIYKQRWHEFEGSKESTRGIEEIRYNDWVEYEQNTVTFIKIIINFIMLY